MLPSPLVHDACADLARMVGLGAIVHGSRGAADGPAWRDEVDVRAMPERATGYEPSVVEGRFMIHVVHRQRSWIVIVEPDVDAKLWVVVTPYEVTE